MQISVPAFCFLYDEHCPNEKVRLSSNRSNTTRSSASRLTHWGKNGTTIAAKKKKKENRVENINDNI